MATGKTTENMLIDNKILFYVKNMQYTSSVSKEGGSKRNDPPPKKKIIP